jgi:hypothetical protein
MRSIVKQGGFFSVFYGEIMSRFPWGHQIHVFEYDFNGAVCEVIKYHPWETSGCTVKTGTIDDSKILFHCDEIHESSDNMFALLISWITNKQLGLNQGALVHGISKALNLCGDE